jgi:hypothetical protein
VGYNGENDTTKNDILKFLSASLPSKTNLGKINYLHSQTNSW